MGLSALQVSVDHLRALNATSVELQEGQRTLGPAVRGHRERLLALLREPSCQGCAEALNRAHALELGADFNQVLAQSGSPLEAGCSGNPGQPGSWVFPEMDS